MNGAKGAPDELVGFAFRCHCRRSIIAPDWRAATSDGTKEGRRLSVAKRVGAPDKRYASPNERVSRQAEHYLLKSQAVRPSDVLHREESDNAGREGSCH